MKISFIVVAIGIAVLDLWTKSYFFEHHAGQGVPVITGWLAIYTVNNPGIPWGLFAGHTWALAVVSAVAVLAILWYFYCKVRSPTWLLTIGLACILGGAIGNLYDRALLGAVRDWILFVPVLPIIDRQWPVFNIADSFIVVGAIGLFLSVSLAKTADGE